MGVFGQMGRLSAGHPWATLLTVLLLSTGALAGLLLPSQTGDATEAFLPADSDLARAQAAIEEDFDASTKTVRVQVLFRGDVLEPAAVQEALDALHAVMVHEAMAPLLADPATQGYPYLLRTLLGGDLEGVTRADVELAMATARDDPNQAPVVARLDGLLARDGDEVVGGLAFVLLQAPDPSGPTEEAVRDAQLAVEEALDGFPFISIEGRSFSDAKLTQESLEAQGNSTNLLMAAALGVILLVLVLFYRSLSDVLLSVIGLSLTLVWVFGLQGWLGPGGLGIIGTSNPLAIMVPVLLIGLTVDYALQLTSRYREGIQAGRDAESAMTESVRQNGVPLLLAASTTAISFLTNLNSSLPPIQDFGIIAGLGVLVGWFVMTTFVPAARTLLDRRRERRGKRVRSQALADSVPGIGRAIQRLSAGIVRRPGIFLTLVLLLSAASFVGASRIDTTFSQTDFLPENTESHEDLIWLDDHFGGGGSTMTLLIEGDLLDDRLLRDLVDLETVLAGPARPDGVTGPTQQSFLTLLFDWASDSGLPGDRYDERFATFLEELEVGFIVPPETIQRVYDELQAVDPEGFGAVVALHADGPDRTLVVLPTAAGDQEATRRLVATLEHLWPGDPAQITVTGSEVLFIVVIDAMIHSQVQSVALTIAAALVLLMAFFGFTRKRPFLGVVTVVPIALVVGWVLGTMYLLGISYNIMTALITALTIGVGVDYTIHITHRFVEERDRGRDVGEALEGALRTTGSALLGSASTTALGFGVLVFSPLAPMQQFGGLTALTILFSLIAAFVVLPPMLVLWALWHDWRLRQIAATLDWGTSPASGWTLADAVGETNTLQCPRCHRHTTVPRTLERLRCPGYDCDFRSVNPAHSSIASKTDATASDTVPRTT